LLTPHGCKLSDKGLGKEAEANILKPESGVPEFAATANFVGPHIKGGRPE